MNNILTINIHMSKEQYEFLTKIAQDEEIVKGYLITLITSKNLNISLEEEIKDTTNILEFPQTENEETQFLDLPTALIKIG